MREIDGIIVADEDDRTEVDRSEEIPNFVTDEEELEFWRTHTFSEKFWRQAKPISEEGCPLSGPEPRQNLTALTLPKLFPNRRLACVDSALTRQGR